MSRYRKSDWLELGWRQLSSEGPDGVKIDILCEKAERSKGSFYHHFTDFDAFLQALIDLWVQRQTTDLMAAFDPENPIEPQMEALVQAVITMDYRFELGVRELARRVPFVAARLAEVDRLRLEFTARIYTLRFGLDAEEALLMAELENAVLGGLVLLTPDISDARQIALYRAYEDLLEAKFGKAMS